jgi:membrane peptidoglycan carboxypeptidase
LAYVLPAPSHRSPHDTTSYAVRRKNFLKKQMNNMVLPKD